jgi:hypothetical protein
VEVAVVEERFEKPKRADLPPYQYPDSMVHSDYVIDLVLDYQLTLDQEEAFGS